MLAQGLFSKESIFSKGQVTVMEAFHRQIGDTAPSHSL